MIKIILFLADKFARLLDVRGAVYILRNGRGGGEDTNGTVVDGASDLLMSSWGDVGTELRNAYVRIKRGAL